MINSIYEKLMKKRFTNAQLKSNILINNMICNIEKYNLEISKFANIFSKFIYNQHQSIIKCKTPEKVWSTL